MSYHDPRYGAPSEPYTPQPQPQPQPPAYQQAGYPQYPPQWQGYYGEQQPPPPPKSRKTLAIMIPICLALLLLVSGSAYFFFFSGTAPDAVVEEYISYAQDEDFVSARSLTTEDASRGVRLEGDGDEMAATRRWFAKDSMDWSVREDSTSAKFSLVTVDKTLTLEGHDEPIEMRWDYELERDSGSWRITRADVMAKVEPVELGGCLISQGLDFHVSGCIEGETSRDLWVVTEKVEKGADCPDPKGTKAEEVGSNEILCLEES